MSRSVSSLVAAVLALSCSSRQQSLPTDAETVVSSLRALNAFPVLEGATAVDRTAAGFHFRPTARTDGSTWTASARSLNVTVGLNGATRLATGDDGAWIEIAPLGSTSATAEVVSSSLVLRNAAPATDVVLAGDGARFEEIRVLRSGDAPRVTRYRISRGPSIADVRIRAGEVEVVDRAGVPVIRSAAAFAVDAKRARRTVGVRLVNEGAETYLETNLDTHGLEFPIAVDPLWVATGSMATARYKPEAVTLSTG